METILVDGCYTDFRIRDGSTVAGSVDGCRFGAYQLPCKLIIVIIGFFRATEFARMRGQCCCRKAWGQTLLPKGTGPNAAAERHGDKLLLPKGMGTNAAAETHAEAHQATEFVRCGMTDLPSN